MTARPWRLETHDSLASTTDLCTARAAAGEAAGLAVLAYQQTGGRGRSGRPWQSPRGNLFLSVLLRPDAPIAESGRFALLAGLVMWTALAGFVPSAARLTLKWPNDVLLDQRKLGGVLIDTALHDDRLDWLVIGFGANLETSPALPDRPTAALAELAPPPAPEIAAAAILAALDEWCGRDWPALRKAWLARAHPVGSPLRLSLGAEMIAGTFAGISDNGLIELRVGEQTRRFAAGEVTTNQAGMQCFS